MAGVAGWPSVCNVYSQVHMTNDRETIMTNTLYTSGTVLWLAALYDISEGHLIDTTAKVFDMLMVF